MQLFILSVTQTLDNQTVLKNMFSNKNIWEALKKGFCIPYNIYRNNIPINTTCHFEERSDEKSACTLVDAYRSFATLRMTRRKGKNKESPSFYINHSGSAAHRNDSRRNIHTESTKLTGSSGMSQPGKLHVLPDFQHLVFLQIIKRHP